MPDFENTNERQFLMNFKEYNATMEHLLYPPKHKGQPQKVWPNMLPLVEAAEPVQEDLPSVNEWETQVTDE